MLGVITPFQGWFLGIKVLGIALALHRAMPHAGCYDALSGLVLVVKVLGIALATA